VSTPTDSSVSQREIGRYILLDLVAENTGTALWLARDPALDRTVAVRIMPSEDPRAARLREAAAAAAKVLDRRTVRVLDVVETDDELAVVTEWVTGTCWLDLLDEGWSAQEVTIVALEVARALESAHQSGVTHGRLRPQSVMITDTREVRLRGLGVDAVLRGEDPFDDPIAADLHGVGALLYVGLTRKWPGPGTLSALPPAPLAGGNTAAASAVAPNVPAALDRVISRSLTTLKSSRDQSFHDMAECVYALENAAGILGATSAGDQHHDDTDRATNRLLGRVGTLLIALLAISGLALLLWQLTLGNSTTAEEAAPAQAPADGATPEEKVSPVKERPFPVVAVQDHDPAGDGSENPDLVNLAVDGRKVTAWTTETYSFSEPKPDEGVGLILDLGAVRPVRAIDLRMTDSGADFAVATTTKQPNKPANFTEILNITGAGEKIRVRTPEAIATRFVLIKLTRLPFDGTNYVGGISEVRILG
jgi:putative peptidoglycan lipid II flippase